MKIIIHSVNLTDFRSFASETIEFADVTCLIGANESGKTNLLDALNLALPKSASPRGEKREMTNSDTRKNSLTYRNHGWPRVTYKLSSELITNPSLSAVLNEFQVDYLTLIRHGNDFSVEIPVSITGELIIKNISDQEFGLGDEILQTSSDATLSQTKHALSGQSKKSIQVIETLSPGDYFLITNKNREYLPYADQVVSDGKARVLEPQQFEEEFRASLLADLQRNLRIFFWSYDKEKYSLPDIIRFEEIRSDIEKRPVIKALFKLGGYEPKDVPSILEGLSETDFINTYETLSRTVTDKIRQKWQTNKDLEIQVVHQPDHLVINIKEPGYSIEPKFHSEGMRLVPGICYWHGG